MIQSFQKFSQSRVAKVFLAIVALSFVAFFGGSSWFRPHDPNATVAEVGNLSISRYELAEKIRQQIQIIMAQSDQPITQEEILNAGLPQQILKQSIQEILLNLEAEHLGLTVSDQVISQQVQSIPAFQNEKKQFDRLVFAQRLRAYNLSEDTFIAEMRRELIRQQLIDAIMVGAYLPDEMLTRLFEAQYQYRQAAMLVISPQEMPLPSLPPLDVLNTFYNEHQKEFETPELRTITALIIDPTLIAKDIPVTAEEIKTLYEEKPEIYGKKTIDEATPLIVTEIQKEKAIEKTYKLTQELDDKIAGGSTLEELAPTVSGSHLIMLTEVSANGLDRMQTSSPQLPKSKELAQEILHTAFSLEEASDSPFTQSPEGVSYLVRVDKVIPSSFQPFEEIKDRVLKVWTENEQLRTAQAKAEAYVKSFNQGDRKVSLMTLLPSLSLSEPSPSVSDKVKELVFSLRPDHAGKVLTPEGVAVVVLNTIIPPTQKVHEEKMPAFKEKQLANYKTDLVIGYVNALRVRYPVKVNTAALKSFFQNEGH